MILRGFESAPGSQQSTLSSFRPLNSSFPRRRESMEGMSKANDTPTVAPTDADLHTVVCRRQPA